MNTELQAAHLTTAMFPVPAGRDPSLAPPVSGSPSRRRRRVCWPGRHCPAGDGSPASTPTGVNITPQLDTFLSREITACADMPGEPNFSLKLHAQGKTLGVPELKVMFFCNVQVHALKPVGREH